MTHRAPQHAAQHRNPHLHHTLNIAHALELPLQAHPAALQPHPLAGWSESLTRVVQIVLRTVSQEHLHVNNCRKRNICPRVSACVLACFRVHNRSPDGQELSSVTPSTRVRSHRRRRMTNSTASETSAALHRPVAYILVLGLPCGWRPGTGTNATPMRAARWSSRWANMLMLVLSRCYAHALAAHIRAEMML